jgi:hypothetical protein
MAMTLSFVGLDGSGHTVTIGKGSGQLVGTPTPFVIQEDDNTDMMLPLRKKSGYINFLDTSGIWQSLIPASSTDITVECDDFFGFVCPDTYGGRFLYRPAEFSLAVVCPLSVLSSFKLSYSAWTQPTLGFEDLIGLIVGQLSTETGVNFGYQWIDGNHANCPDFSHLKIQWEALFDSDDDYAAAAKYNNEELLSHICEFLGVTCRCNSTTFVLVAVDTGTFSSVSASDFLLADVESTEEVIQGYGIVKVKGSINEETLIDIPYSRITNQNLQLQGVTCHSWAYNGNGVVVYFMRNISGTGEWGMIPQQYDFNDISYDSNGNDFKEIWIDNQATSIDNDPYGKEWRCVIESINRRESNPSAFVLHNLNEISLFTGKKKKFASGGYIEITGRSHYFDRPSSGSSNFNDETPKINMVATLRIGDMWFNGTSWEQTPSNRIPYFCLWSDGGVLGKMVWASQSGAPASFFEAGYKIPVIEGMGGVVEIGIGPCLAIDGNKDYVYIESLNVIYHRDTGYRDKTSISRTASNSTPFADSKDVDTIFCQDSDQMKAGPELLVYDNARYYGSQNGDTDLMQNLANRIAAIGSKSRHVINLNLRNSDPVAAVGPGDTVSYNSKTYYPLAISKDPGRGMTTVKLVEK